MITLEPTFLNKNGTMKIRVVARNERGTPIDADVLTVESGISRKRFVNRLADKTGESAEAIDALLLGVLDTAVASPRPPSDAVELLAQMAPEVREEAESLLRDPELVQRIRLDIRALGLAGDETVALGVYLIGTSRLLNKPLAGIVRGASSSGKSFAIATVAKLFPPESKIETHHLSGKALYYMPDDALVHKFVVAGERPRRQDDEQADATKALPEMISDGILRAAIVESVAGQFRTVRYEKPGPIAYIDSTSATRIFAEDANRCLVLDVDEGEGQTRTIVMAMARAAAGSNADVEGVIVCRATLAPSHASDHSIRFDARGAIPRKSGRVSAGNASSAKCDQGCRAAPPVPEAGHQRSDLRR